MFQIVAYFPDGMGEMSLAAWSSARKCSDMLVGLSTAWSVVFVEAIFGSSLCFSYVSFDIVCRANSVESES